APEGYRFAPDVAMLAPDDGKAPALRALHVRGLRGIEVGTLPHAPAIVRFDRDADAATLAELGAHARGRPTFIRRAGRRVAARCRVVVIGATKQGRDRALAKLVKRAPASVRRLQAKVEAAVDHVRIVEMDPWAALDAVATPVPGATVELDMIRPYE